MHFAGEAFKRGLSGGTVYFFVVAVSYPACQGVIELRKAGAFKQGQKAAAYGFKPSFDFTFSLGRVGLGVDQAYGK